MAGFSSCGAKVSSIVQDHTQEGIVDVDLAVVFDEAQFPKFVHEEIDPRTRCANDLRQHLLRYFGKHLVKIARCAIAGEQQKSARQPFLAGVEKLVDQVLLHSYVACQHVGDEAVREFVFGVERPNHLVFLNHQYGGGCNRGRSRYANGLARKASFSKKSPGPRIATTASLPLSFTTVSRTPPS